MRAPLIMLLFASLAVQAADPKPTPEPARTALPPPAFEDKGVSTPAPATPPPASAAADESLEPVMPDTRLVRDKASRDREKAIAEARTQSDSVTQRQQGDDNVEEYREKGRLRMLRIIPRTGPEQIYLDNNGDGRLERDPTDGPVAPVYFTIYQWN